MNSLSLINPISPISPISPIGSSNMIRLTYDMYDNIMCLMGLMDDLLDDYTNVSYEELYRRTYNLFIRSKDNAALITHYYLTHPNYQDKKINVAVKDVFMYVIRQGNLDKPLQSHVTYSRQFVTLISKLLIEKAIKTTNVQYAYDSHKSALNKLIYDFWLTDTTTIKSVISTTYDEIKQIDKHDISDMLFFSPQNIINTGCFD